MKTVEHMMVLLVVGSAGLFLAGCSEPQGVQETTLIVPPAPSGPQAVPFKIQMPGQGGGLNRVQDRDNLQQVISFAFNLSDQGMHADAAVVFYDASCRFDSTDSQLRQDLIRASIYEAWNAGQPELVRQYFGVLSRYQNGLYDHLEAKSDKVLWEIHEIVFDESM